MSEPGFTPGPAEQLGRGFAVCAAIIGTIGLLTDCAPLLWLACAYELAAAYYLRPSGDR